MTIPLFWKVSATRPLATSFLPFSRFVFYFLFRIRRSSLSHNQIFQLAGFLCLNNLYWAINDWQGLMNPIQVFLPVESNWSLTSEPLNVKFQMFSRQDDEDFFCWCGTCVLIPKNDSFPPFSCSVVPVYFFFWLIANQIFATEHNPILALSLLNCTLYLCLFFFFT